ncbi:hypothetical protein GCM10010112_39520 [Actinoplanes lobatus]|uniref:Uncharacterized protein n=1 Tax=Actinoplanes lobatus TaxID=113568 RepID=A0A7W7HH40_9ACTN|nr:hypothetical protein [Actinoplanes lobatus]MBB4750404.1 hypothetical protein [Actinoplanes lobatus]GGN71866.1 hypothetical protein GCM10010112_39520 [Actinoplanes lobatus]GIE45268.1 hypothetical protein Alo02nite_81660 [Actinoplanes lobatus]
MHDEMMTLIDDCIARMTLLRDQLAASRRVQPGERHTTVLDAIAVAERFATEATRTVSPPSVTLSPPATGPVVRYSTAG